MTDFLPKRGRKRVASVRVPRPLLEKIQALDDHLFLLREAWHKLSSDAAMLKPLSSELRLLVCKSSHTDGLIWRLAKEMEVDDTVLIHNPTPVDPDLPNSSDLHFQYSPLLRGGKGASRSPERIESLQTVIKERSAVFLSGEHLTYQEVISLVSNQIGSAHEDETVSQHLYTLGGIILNDRPTLSDILVRCAEFTLQIGERILINAASQHGYMRKVRRGYGDLSLTIMLKRNIPITADISVVRFTSEV